MTEAECSSSSHTRDDLRPYRKTNKPLMEKRRRTRINMCLVQLKALVLQATKKDNTQYSKLEKADILELTVKHLRNIQRSQIGGGLTPPDALGRYRAGFSECAQEVLRFLGGAAVPEDVRQRVSGHLARCLASLTEQHLNPHHHYHHVQHLQQRGLVSLGQAPMLLPHPAFPAPSQPAVGQACLVAGPSTLAACSFIALPAQVPLVQEVGSSLSPDSHDSLVSLAAAPTAFQIPPSATTTTAPTTTTTTAMSESLVVTEAFATPSKVEPVQVALVLTSSQAAKHIFTPSPAPSVPSSSGDDVVTPNTVLPADVLSVATERRLSSFGSVEMMQEPDLPASPMPHTPVSRSPRTPSPDSKSFKPQSCVSTPFRLQSPISTAFRPEQIVFKSIRPQSYGCKYERPRSPIFRFTRSQSYGGELPKPQSFDGRLSRPQCYEDGLPRPQSSDGRLSRPQSSDDRFHRHQSSDGGFPRPHSTDGRLRRPQSSDSDLPRLHSSDGGLFRPQSSDSGLPRLQSSDGGLFRPQLSDVRPRRTLFPVSIFMSSSSETPSSSSRPGSSPPVSPCAIAAEEKMWRPW